MAELNRIQKFFSEEVSRQINQFTIDIISDVLSEIDKELDTKGKTIGLTVEQHSKFHAVLIQAQHKVLSKYGLEVASVEDVKHKMS